MLHSTLWKTSVPPFQLIIFDCDGTLVDTERVGNQVIVESLQNMGHAITLDEALAAFAGRKMADTLKLIEERLGAPLPPAFLDRLREDMAVAFEERLETMPGVPDVLDFLQAAHVPRCVASNGPHEKMEISLGVTGLLPYFGQSVFSAYECKSWKPDPGLFFFAAEKMGYPPSACAVVEDSAFGVRGGIAAGMTVFGYAPRHEGNDLKSLGARVFHHMDELPHLLRSMP
jgi:HAD superfamily hydrolase (TIGR01509 family)